MITIPLFTLLREQKEKISILQGGGDAGKTVVALQYLSIDSIENPNTITTVTGQDLPNLKGGALRSFQRYVLPDIQQFIKNFNISESVYHFHNGSKIEFKSFKDELDARGSERDNLFMNEANSQTWSMFWQLQRKTRKKVILDYNPTAPFWVHTNLIDGGEKQFTGKWKRYITDHRHNPFLSDEEHESYEKISDPDLFNVYARGLTGKIKGLIFGHFKKIDFMPPCTRYVWGIDYGYTNDPTAIVKMGVNGRTRYFQEISYEPGLSAEHIVQLFHNNGWEPSHPIFSEHDAEMILQLRKLRMPISQAKKGPGSIVAGISKMKEYECFYIGDNFENEIINYKYITAKDLLTGKEILTNEPLAGADHLCDASRYACYTDSFINRNG